MVHYLTVYTPPKNDSRAVITIRRLRWFLNRIFFIDKDSLFVVAGDFNKVGMSKSKFIENYYHLTAVISKTRQRIDKADTPTTCGQILIAPHPF